MPNLNLMPPQWQCFVTVDNIYIFFKTLLKSLAEAELDDGKDLIEEDEPPLNPVVRERGSVQLSNIQEPVTVRGWPMGLALASAPSITVSLTATGLQKIMSVMATLNLPSRRGQYKVETNQCTEELASIRAQPRVWEHFSLIFCYLPGLTCQLQIFFFFF